MTREEHRKIEISMKCKITKLNNKSKNGNFNLEEKIVMKRKVKEMREELRKHVLNFFELTA